MKFLATVSVLTAAASAAAIADPWCTKPGQPCWKEKREALAEPEADPWCTKPGQPCWREKRAAEAEPWCTKPGQPCWKVKRASEAFNSALAGSGDLLERSPEALLSHTEGGAAFMAKRSLDELANIVAASQTDPFSFYHGLAMERRFLEDTTPVARREAMPEAEADPWCTKPGQPCWKEKRDAEADPWCTKPGQPCWKEKRDLHSEDKRWCTKPGQPCWKVRRAAEALAEAAAEPSEDLATRDFNPLSAREPEPWCTKPGQPCWKRDADPEPWCTKPGQPCWKAKRDLHAMHNAARAVLESLN